MTVSTAVITVTLLYLWFSLSFLFFSLTHSLSSLLFFCLYILFPLSSLCSLLTRVNTHSAHTPDNSFMGFVSEEMNETEKRSIQQNKVNNMAVVYGKEASMWKVQTI